MKPLVIGIAGRAGSGKSTAAKLLIEKHGFTRVSFADPLKALTRKVFDFTTAQVHGSQAEKEAVDPRWGISPREALIRLGNATREEIGGDVWLRAALKKIEGLATSLKRFVIDDVRYPNEVEMITRSLWFEGYVVKLECSDAITSVDPNTPSERSVDEIQPEMCYATISRKRSKDAGELLAAFEDVIGSLWDKGQ